MTDNLITTREKVEHSMKRRRAAESRFRVYGMASVLFGLLCLVVLFGNILSKGTSAFTQTFVTTEILLDGDTLGLTSKSDDDEIRRANFDGLIKNHLKATMQPDGRKECRQLYSLISS